MLQITRIFWEWSQTVDLLGLEIPAALALATVATLGYLVGRRSNNVPDEVAARSKRELDRARAVARELEKIARMVRKNLARHHAGLNKFNERVGQLDAQGREAAWMELCREAEEMLAPTLRLANQISNACDMIRHETNHLMTFTEVRTDPLTGVCNRRGMDEALATQFAMLDRYEVAFSVAIFDLDHFKRINDKRGHLEGDRLLHRVASLLDDTARQTDVVARYGGEEFLVVMPETDLEQASIFADRFRARVETELAITLSGGVASALDGDTSDSLLARADAALYAAKSEGRNRVSRHNGRQIESIWEELPAGQS